MVKITDVAKKANVSISTVSRALNDSSYVSKKTKQKILEICKELNFKPNFFASNIAGRNTRIIGLIANSKPDYAYYKRDNRIIHTCALEASLSNNGFYMRYVEDFNEIEDMLSLGRIPIDGAILSSPKIDGLSEKVFKKGHIPFVVLGNPVNSSIPHVNVDNIGLVKTISSRLIESYGKNIYLLNSEQEATISKDRYNAFLEVCNENDINISSHHYYLDNPDNVFLNRNISSKIKKDSAFIVADEKIARNIYSLIEEKNLKVGEDVAVFSLGIDDENEPFEPKLSYASQDYVAIGKSAVHLLLEHIAGNDKVKKVILDSDIRIAESTSRLI